MEHLETCSHFDQGCDPACPFVRNHFRRNPMDPHNPDRPQAADQTTPSGVSPLGPTLVQGRKDDHGKLEWSLLPRLVLRPVVRVLMFGARKYGRENWRHVPDAQRRYYDAAQRHLEAWWNDPSSRDPDTGESHLAHLVCCALFLMGLEDLE